MPATTTSQSTTLPYDQYRRKVLGCWLGKAVGGTLGGPWEGHFGPLELSFYNPVPQEMLPNDDLDLQVVWLEAIRRHGLPVDRKLLADAWLEHVHMWPDEYGVACRNLTRGIMPPVSGSFDNGFTAGMGAAIRTELWACLAPGVPQLAAALAYEDACVDHAGEGIHAATFLAVLQSMAFISDDREALLDTALASIPADSRVARAIADTRTWWQESGNWQQIRAQILDKHGDHNFTDVAQNLAFTVLGWLAGTTFGERICIAVNCGKDTDCTGATLGALLGILDPDAIEDRWLEPIGRDLVLSASMVGMHHPDNLETFTDHVAAAAVETLAYYHADMQLEAAPPLPALPAPRLQQAPCTLPGAILATNPLAVSLDYGNKVAFAPDECRELTLHLQNLQSADIEGRMTITVPDNWKVKVQSDATFALAPGARTTCTLTITAPSAAAVRTYRNPLDIRITANGLDWTINGGLVQTMPWLADGTTQLEAEGHYLQLPAGPITLETEVKLPWPGMTYRFIAQAARSVILKLNGEVLVQHDGSHHVPAIHRAKDTAKDHRIGHAGWFRLTAELGDGEACPFFICIGDGDNWNWIRNAEWRQILK